MAIRLAGSAAGISLVILALSGYIKGLGAFRWVPFDLTSLSFCCLTLLTGWAVFRKNCPVHPSWKIVVLVWMCFIPGVLLSSFHGISLGKSALLFTLTLVATLAPAVLRPIPTFESAILWTVFAVCLVAGLTAWMTPPPVNPEISRLTVEGGTSITLGRLTGCGALFAAIRAMTDRGPWTICWLAIASGFAWLTISVGARGPFGSLLAALVIAAMSARFFHGQRQRVFLPLTLLGVGAVFSVFTVKSLATQRLQQVMSGNVEDPARTYLYNAAADAALQQPWGLGWAGFNELPQVNQVVWATYTYPHNFILEIAAEGGAVALVGIAILVAMGLRQGFLGSTDTRGLIFYVMSVYWLLCAMVSSDINGNRIAWTFLALALAHTVRPSATAAMPPFGTNPRTTATASSLPLDKSVVGTQTAVSL